jgi:hypothetical protein
MKLWKWLTAVHKLDSDSNYESSGRCGAGTVSTINELSYHANGQHVTV